MKHQQNYKQNSMNTTFSLMPGSKTIGNYIISKNLGQGTFGKVKLGIHSQTNQKVAIKILQKSKISDLSDVQRVTRQLSILKQIRHPNIIQLYQIIQTPKQLFLVMQYISDGQLFDHIVRLKRLKQQQACQYFQQIIAGVEYLHGIGIVHRDLKPENLLIDFDGRVKIVDFGLSGLYKGGDVLKTACGSPCYAAPEMIAGKKYDGLLADLWSCGVVLYAMLCGYLPFQDPNTPALYKKIIAGQFKIPKFISPSAKQLLKCILTTDPLKRITLSQIKSHQWFKSVTNSPFYNHASPPIGIKVSHFLIPFDQSVLPQLQQFDPTAPDQVRKYIANNRHNHTATAYYLILKRRLREGRGSTADFCYGGFDRGLLVGKGDTGGKDSKVDKEGNSSTGGSLNTSLYSNFSNQSRMGVRGQRNYSQKEKEREEKTIQEIDLGRNTVTSNGFRLGTRAVNRINLKDFSSQNRNKNNNYVTKKRQDSVDFKIDFDNLPVVQNMTKISQKKRRLNMNTYRNKHQQLSDLYGVDDVFRATAYISRSSRAQAPKTPIPFRTSLNQPVQSRESRYQSLQVPHESVSISTSVPHSTHQKQKQKQKQRQRQKLYSQQKQKQKQKQQMNKTFMGRITKTSIPKWSDESERIRSILNKTITGHGRRKRRDQF